MDSVLSLCAGRDLLCKVAFPKGFSHSGMKFIHALPVGQEVEKEVLSPKPSQVSQWEALFCPQLSICLWRHKQTPDLAGTGSAV